MSSTTTTTTKKGSLVEKQKLTLKTKQTLGGEVGERKKERKKLVVISITVCVCQLLCPACSSSSMLVVCPLDPMFNVIIIICTVQLQAIENNLLQKHSH